WRQASEDLEVAEALKAVGSEDHHERGALPLRAFSQLGAQIDDRFGDGAAAQNRQRPHSGELPRSALHASDRDSPEACRPFAHKPYNSILWDVTLKPCLRATAS